MKRFKRTLSAVISAAMILQMGVTPVLAAAGGGVRNSSAPASMGSMEYDIGNGSLTLAAEDGCSAQNPHVIIGEATEMKVIEISSGEHHIKLKDMSHRTTSYNGTKPTIGIASGASVYLTLEGTSQFEGASKCAGISVPEGASLVIEDSPGTLNVTGGNYSAGIGGSQNFSAGNITINGGTINATGGTSYGAGIGGGMGGHAGNITINGGKITAKGNYEAVGIGGGNGIKGNKDKGTVTITGGTVIATACNGPNPTISAAGIGDSNRVGGITVTINGDAVVCATGGDRAEHIGNGYLGQGSTVNRTKGVIFEDNNGIVYGDVVLQDDLTIAAGKILTVSEGATLDINGKTLINNGVMIAFGTVIGTVIGTVTNVQLIAQPQDGSAIYGSPHELTFAAKTSEGELGYQWYENSTNSNTGGTAIEGATDSSYITLADSVIGTHYYYCIITVNGTSYASRTAAVEVTAPVGGVASMNGIAYNTLQEAFDAVGSGTGTVKLLVDKLPIMGQVAINSGTVTFDLNGNTLTASDQAKLACKSGAKLIVMDSSAGGTGKIEKLVSGQMIEAAGDVTVNSGTITTLGVAIGSVTPGVEITINGGVVESTDGRERTIFTQGANSIINIKGGIVRSIEGNTIEASDAIVNIEGGTVVTSGSSIYNQHAIYALGLTAAVNISGGTIKADQQDSFAVYSYGDVNITGGNVISNDGKAITINSLNNRAVACTVSNAVIIGGCREIQDAYPSTFIGGNPQWSVRGMATLSTDVTVPADKTFTIPSGADFTIPAGVTFINNGTFSNGGKVTNSGTLRLDGSVSNGGTITGSGTFKTAVFTAGDIAAIPEQPYTGSAIEPTPADNRRTIGGKEFDVLLDGYLRTYDNNIEITDAAKVIYTSKSDSSVKVEKSFCIGKGRQQNFEVTAVTGKVYGGEAFTLAASGGNGSGIVTFDVPKDNGVLTISGDTATIVGSGTVPVTATKAGDNKYNEVSHTRPITIGKAVPVITLTAEMINPQVSTVILKVSVSGINGEKPTGTITLRDGAIVLAEGIPVIDGTASFTWESASIGAHNAAAEFFASADGAGMNYSGGVSTPIAVTVNEKPNPPEPAKKYTITLNANGGYISKKSVKSSKKTVTYGKNYGSLVTPKRSKYAFVGWYTKKSGGSRITSSDRVKLTANRTYYAQWAKIKPKKASISSVKNTGKGKITVKIKNIREASGYQLRYSLKSNLSSAKTSTLSSPEKSISKLKKGKTYYVQVRMYQKESVSGKKYYGSWSSTKRVKIKK